MASSQELTTPSKLSKDSNAFPSFTGKDVDPLWDSLVPKYKHKFPFTYAGPHGVKITAFFELDGKPPIPSGLTSCMACRKTLKWTQYLVGPDGNLLDVRILEGLSYPLDTALFTPDPTGEVKTICLRPPSHVVVGEGKHTNTPHYGHSSKVTETVQKWSAEHPAERHLLYTHIPVTNALDGNDPDLIAKLEKLVQNKLPERIIAWLKASVGTKDDVAYLTTLADAINTADAARYPHLRLSHVVGELEMIREIITIISTGAPDGVSAMTPIQLYDLALKIICPTIGGGVTNPVPFGWKIFQHLLYALSHVAQNNPESGGQADILRSLNARFDPSIRGIPAAAKARSDHAVQEACLKEGSLIITIAVVWGIDSPDDSIPAMSGKTDIDVGCLVTNLKTGEVIKITYDTQKKWVTIPGAEAMLDFDNTGNGGTCVENITIKIGLSSLAEFSIRFLATVYSGSDVLGKYLGVEQAIPQQDGSIKKTVLDIKCPQEYGTCSKKIEGPDFFPLGDPILVNTGDYQDPPPQPEMTEKELRRLAAQEELVKKCFGATGTIVSDFLGVSVKPKPAPVPSSFADLLVSGKPKSAKKRGIPRLGGLAENQQLQVNLDKGQLAALILQTPEDAGALIKPFNSLVFIDATGKATPASLVPPGTAPFTLPDSMLPPADVKHGNWEQRMVSVLTSIETGTEDVPGPRGTLYVVKLGLGHVPVLIGRGLHHSNPVFRIEVDGVDISHALKRVLAHMDGLPENFVRKTENPAIGVWISADAPPEDHPQPQSVRPRASARWSTSGAPRPSQMPSASQRALAASASFTAGLAASAPFTGTLPNLFE